MGSGLIEHPLWHLGSGSGLPQFDVEMFFRSRQRAQGKEGL